MPLVHVKEVLSTTRHQLDVPDEVLPRDLRSLVAEATGLPLERLKIILHGRPVPDAGKMRPIRFVDGDVMIAMVAPKPPPTSLVSPQAPVEEEEEEVRFRLPESASPLQRWFANVLRDRMRLPDFLLVALFSISLRTWLIMIVWFILAPFVNQLVGPVYLIVSGMIVIFMNLGRRKPGELSAYSWFNPDCRELPGTLNADRLDRDIRTGHY